MDIHNEPKILCPNCGLLSPINTKTCECGYRFKRSRAPYIITFITLTLILVLTIGWIIHVVSEPATEPTPSPISTFMPEPSAPPTPAPTQSIYDENGEYIPFHEYGKLDVEEELEKGRELLEEQTENNSATFPG